MCNVRKGGLVVGFALLMNVFFLFVHNCIIGEIFSVFRLLFSRGFVCFWCVCGVIARGALRSSFLLELSIWFRFFRWPSIRMAGVVNGFIVPDTVEVEDGIVDVISGLRGSQAEGAVDEYVRYTGRQEWPVRVFRRATTCEVGGREVTVEPGVVKCADGDYRA